MNTSIVRTIYSELDKLNDGPINLSEEEIEKTGEAIKDALRHWSTPQSQDKFTVRMSNLGKPLRQIWFDSKKQAQARLGKSCLFHGIELVFYLDLKECFQEGRL